MLVLGRKENQSILIGDNIRITIVGRSGSSIRIGVEAPVDVRVLREECAVRDGAQGGEASCQQDASRQLDRPSPQSGSESASDAGLRPASGIECVEGPSSGEPQGRSMLVVPTLQTTLEGDLLEVITAVSGV